MQNYGGYYSQYPQGQNNMYQGSGQSNMNQSNTRNMFGGPQNFGIPQMQQAPPQQYGYQQQQTQMPQQNFVFHFDLNNAPPNMNMGPYAPVNPPQFGVPPYGGPQIPQGNTQKKEDKNDELFNAFDPFNPKPRTQSKPRPQPQQPTNTQPSPPSQPQIQIIENTPPPKQDLNAFRSAFASLAGPAQQPPPQPQQQQQFGMQPGQMLAGNMQAPSAPQIEGFNFASGLQNTQSPQVDGFNFGSQQPQITSIPNQAPQPGQSTMPGIPSQPQTAPAAASKNKQEDIFSSFNPIAPSQPTTPNLSQPTGNQANNANQFVNSDTFSFTQPQAGSGSGFNSFNQQQTGSTGGILSFDPQQTGSGGGFTPFGQQQQQTGSGGGFTPIGQQQQTGSTGRINTFNPPQLTTPDPMHSSIQQQTGSGSGFTPFGQQQQTGSTGGLNMSSFDHPHASTIDPIQSFNQPQNGSGSSHPPFNTPQSGSTGGLPISAIDDLFGPPSSSSSKQPQQPQPSTSNPFLFNVSTDSNPFVKKNNEASSPGPLTQTATTNTQNLQQNQQQGLDGNIFNPFVSPQNQPKQASSSTSFADSFRQAIGEPSPSSPPTQPTEPPKPNENEVSDFRNIFSQGHNFFEKQEQELKTEQKQEGFTFSSQQPTAPTVTDDGNASNFSNFTFNTPAQSEPIQNSQFGNSIFSNFGNSETQQPISPEKQQQPQQQQQEQPSTPFTPFGVSDLQPMSNSTFVFSGSGDSVSSQPIAVSADPVDKEKIPYFVEQEKKMEFENRIKNDTMSVFDPFNPNPQHVQQQQQQQQIQQQPQQQNEMKKQEEPKLSASVNASVDTIRNMFGGPSEQNEEEKEEEKKQEPEPEPISFQQNQPKDDNQNVFLGGFTTGFSSENKESQNKTSDIQLNIGIGDENNNIDDEGMGHHFASGGQFQANFGSSPEANQFGFGGFGFDNSFGRGNVFQHAFDQANMDKPATFADFFPHSEPLNAPVKLNEPKVENKENVPPKSDSPFATGFDLTGITIPKQTENQTQNQDQKQQQESNPFIFGQNEKIDFNNPFGTTTTKTDEPQQKQEESNEQPQQSQPQQKQKEVDYDNPFINQSNITLFGQAPSNNDSTNQQQTQKTEPFNPFGSQSLETAPQTSSSQFFSSADAFSSQAQITKPAGQEKPKKESTRKETSKGGDIFDEIPSDISEIDKSLPEKPPPFEMPTIGDNAANPFTSVLSSSSATSNPFTSNTATNNANPFASASNPFVPQTNSTEKQNTSETKTESTNPFTLETTTKQENDEKQEQKQSNNNFDDLIGFDFGFSTPKQQDNNNINQQNEKEKESNVDNPFIASFNTNQNETEEQKVEKDKSKEEDKSTTEATTTTTTTESTSGFTFSSATPNDSSDANPFSKGFNPFGGDFNSAFTAATITTNEDNQNGGGFTFTPSFEKEEEKTKEENNEENKGTAEKKEEDHENKENKENNEDNNNLNINDTLNDDLFDLNSIESFKPQPIKGKADDIFGGIHTFPVSNSTSDFLEMKQKKEAKNNVGQSTLMSDGGIGSKAPSSPLIDNTNNNAGFISIISPYAYAADQVAFSASDDNENPDVLKIMSDDNPMSKILKKFIKQPENDFYGSFEKDPHPIRIFPKFEDTNAAKVLAEFVSNQFGITASFASTSRKQQEEIDMNSIFNVPAASEPNDDDDFLLII